MTLRKHGESRTTASAAELTTVAWLVGGDLPYSEWLRHGSRLGLVARSAGWWIGDWLRYGARRYGRKYAVAARVTGYDHQTLMNMVYVATRFEVSRRREHLSWSHHAELAALDVEEQDSWLDRAAAQRLTVRDLRRELWAVKERAAGVSMHSPESGCDGESASGSARAPQGRDSIVAASSPAGLTATKIVTCPECGHRFDGASVEPLAR